MTVITFSSSIQLLVLGVFGEYLGRMYEQVKGRPLFIIDQVVRFDGVADRDNGPTAPISVRHAAVGAGRDRIEPRRHLTQSGLIARRPSETASRPMPRPSSRRVTRWLPVAR